MKMWTKIRRPVSFMVLILICYLCQITFCPAIEIGSIKPDLLIILTSSIGFIRGRKDGMIVGMICGLLLDIQAGDLIGFYALLHMLTGFINGCFQRMFYEDDMVFPMVMIGVSDLIYGLAVYISRFMLRSRFDFSFYFVRIILPAAIYTVIAAVFVYRIVLWLNRKLEAEEKRSASKFV